MAKKSSKVCRKHTMPNDYKVQFHQEAFVKYLCLMYCEALTFEEMLPAGLETFQRDCAESDNAMRASGHLKLAQALQSPLTAVTVRVRGGKTALTDGPFAETKEHLCGFILIEAQDMDEAKNLAARNPFAKAGSVEIRPLMEDWEPKD